MAVTRGAPSSRPGRSIDEARPHVTKTLVAYAPDDRAPLEPHVRVTDRLGHSPCGGLPTAMIRGLPPARISVTCTPTRSLICAPRRRYRPRIPNPMVSSPTTHITPPSPPTPNRRRAPGSTPDAETEVLRWPTSATCMPSRDDPRSAVRSRLSAQSLRASRAACAPRALAPPAAAPARWRRNCSFAPPRSSSVSKAS